MSKVTPFSEEELKVVGGFKKAGGVVLDKFNTPITAKENYMRLLRKEKPFWMPNDDMITFNPAMIPDNVARNFVVEETPCDRCDGKDMFGIDWVYIESAGGSMVKPGNPVLKDANDWKEAIKFPDIDSWDWKDCAERNKEFLSADDVPIFTVFFNGLFERLISFMDFEEAAVSLIDEDQKEAVKELFNALTDLYIKMIDYEIRYFNISGILFHDDWGSQRAPFFSIETHREMIAPYIKKIADYCHSRNLIMELHSCGCTEKICESIAETGIDMWRPQPMNNIDSMYKLYGDKFLLGIRIPMFAPDATNEEKIASAKEFAHRYTDKGKYVYTSSPFQDPVFRAALYEESRKMFAASED